ncbi:MAG TPA: bifunctional 2-C-methyl-D-erythritol 4-phosphate cytidylyltransferase/2-C-methyl-D-erythritol 2,4-cyclodiphosphate synthase [Rhizomicrobium sp.]|jgi:2-C-methyl-D-erythritol 4-phosphate cytidylyltransferase/2-C-methyl-D-erythritol 2,4-cyclodiphosphate synthase
MSDTAIVIVAAGQGQRAGGPVPKQFQPLLGAPVLRRSVAAFAGRPDINLVQIVTSADRHAESEIALDGLSRLPFVTGGATRQQSVRNGLEALAPHAPDFVLVHDAARPLVTPALIGRVIDTLEQGAVAAIPLVSVADTLKRDDAGAWTTVPRDGLYRAQTPQGFRFSDLLTAHRKFAGTNVTDDMALAELAGLSITRVRGEETNLKITTEEDFSHAARLLRGTMSEFHTGMGFDAHRFTDGDHVWLCGVKIAHSAGLEGHSDADAGLHALTDAILGAVGAGDIGQHFPPTDEKWRGAASAKFLEHAARLVDEAGGAIVHCDVTLICERPKIGPHREAMRTRIADILRLELSRISVKATTTERMGFTGRGEGLAAQAVATIRLPAS